MYKDVVNNLDLFKIQIPKTIVPVPTDTDYELGFIRRYFTQKSNDPSGHIYEIDEEVYSELTESPFWKVADMKWRIRGPLTDVYNENGTISDMSVSSSNNASIRLIGNKLNNIALYLPNLLQFYKR
jgi:hypothetical protein